MPIDKAIKCPFCEQFIIRGGGFAPSVVIIAFMGGLLFTLAKSWFIVVDTLTDKCYDEEVRWDSDAVPQL